MTECIMERCLHVGTDTYNYELIYNEETSRTSIGIGLYSLRIRMQCGENGRVTEAHTGEIFADEKKAVRFFEKLCNNLATPIDLAYIVEDEFG